MKIIFLITAIFCLTISSAQIANSTDYTNSHNIAVNYYNDAKTQAKAGNYVEAIEQYTKALENYPIQDQELKAEAFYNRGISRRKIENFSGAIEDYTKAIELKPGYYKAFNNRGCVYLIIKDYAKAIMDFTLVIKYDNYNTEFTAMALGYRCVAKINIGKDGCPDFKKAIELCNVNVSQFLSENCK